MWNFMLIKIWISAVENKCSHQSNGECERPKHFSSIKLGLWSHSASQHHECVFDLLNLGLIEIQLIECNLRNHDRYSEFWFFLQDWNGTKYWVWLETEPTAWFTWPPTLKAARKWPLRPWNGSTIPGTKWWTCVKSNHSRNCTTPMWSN